MSSHGLTELRTSNDARDDVDELRRRLEVDGYLFFRRLLDPLRLLNLRHEMLTLPKITKYLEQAFEEAIQLARSGDARARLHLRRIVLRDPESPQGKMEVSVLEALAVR